MRPKLVETYPAMTQDQLQVLLPSLWKEFVDLGSNNVEDQLVEKPPAVTELVNSEKRSRSTIILHLSHCTSF